MPKVFSDLKISKAINLLSDLINIPTVNSDEKTLAFYICNYFKDTGLKTEIREISENRANIVVTMKGRNSKNALMLNGHLDTVPYGNVDSWATPPKKAVIIDDKLYGRGASDMKSGLSAMIFALKELALEGYVPENDIILLGTADEESDGLGAEDILNSGILNNVKSIVIGEPTSNNIAVASKGTLWLELTIHGKTSHGAYPQEGINAVEMAFKINEFIKSQLISYSHDILIKPTSSLNKIEGGIKVNMVPDLCKATFDIRTLPEIKHNILLENIKKYIEYLKKEYKGLKAEINIITDRKSVETDVNHKLVKTLSDTVEEITSIKPKIIGTGYFTDASIFLRNYDIPTILFGPGDSEMAHKPNEFVSLDKYSESIESYYNFIKKI